MGKFILVAPRANGVPLQLLAVSKVHGGTEFYQPLLTFDTEDAARQYADQKYAPCTGRIFAVPVEVPNG